MRDGKATRRQLSDELDQLDRVIDALADGLNRVVTDAVKDGARGAVRDVLSELLASPGAAGLLRPTAGSEPPAADEPGVCCKIKAAAGVAGAAVRQVALLVVRKVSAAARTALGTVATMTAAVWARVRAVRQVFAAARWASQVPAVGAAAAVVTRLGRAGTSVLGGAGTVMSAVAARAAGWLRPVRVAFTAAG